MSLSWEIIGKSVQGALHKKQGKEHQDAWGWNRGEDYLVVAIADGLGSDKCPFSRVGAEIGVDVAVNQLLRFWKQVNSNSPRGIKRLAKESLPKSIVRKWRGEVLEDYRKRWNKSEEDSIFTLYGTTLLAILVTEKFVVQLQLGDGDIVNFYHSGASNKVRRVFELGTEFLGNKTTSLSQRDAERKLNVTYESLSENDLGLILLATDGYSNSFRTDDAFFKAVKDFWDYLSEGSADLIEDNLRVWLTETSQEGSGDDITVALIYKQALSMGGE
ncbi:MAG: protein phosphatase 2C domain-containing protein [Thermoplasmatales archaeon]|nr:protein phosphatase 2C domain-containing protein [Thermoplasmatales archaeon]